jgi:NitT/TauT family transport system ATP-binding protein
MGRSGIGKSTLINLVAGYLRPTSGELLERGERIIGPSRSRIVVFQESSLWPWRPLWANVSLGLPSTMPAAAKNLAVDSMLDKLGLLDARDALPPELSGGMSKRGELARALIAEPKVLMLDEALGSLDPLTKRICIEAVREFKARTGAAILMVTHDVQDASRVADRILVLTGQPAEIAGAVPIENTSQSSIGDVSRAVLALLGEAA